MTQTNEPPSAGTFRLPWLLPILLIGLLTAVHLRLRPYAFDDAYIHFRVARNLVETGTPYFDALTPLKVSTSSGWVIFLAGLYALARAAHLQNSFPLLVSLANALVTAGVVLLAPRLVETVQKKPLPVVHRWILQAIVLALLLPCSIGLMETPLALLAAGTGLYLFLLSSPWCFALLGAAAYLRLELSVFLALLCILGLWKGKFTVRQMIGYGMVGTLPFVVFDLFFYRTLVPHSLLAKSRIYSLTPAGSLADILLRSLPGLPPMAPLQVAGFLTLVILPGWLAIREIRRPRDGEIPALLLCTGVLIAGLYILGHSLLFDWYVPLYMLPLALAVFLYATCHLENRVLAVTLLCLGFFSALSLGTTLYSAFSRPDRFVLFESGSRVRMYLTVGRILDEDYPGRSLLTSEIGGLGYSFGGRLLDAAGLASAEALLFHPLRVPSERSAGNLGAIPPGYVRRMDPDLIVSYDIFAEALLRDDVASRYNIIALPAYLPEDGRVSASQTLWGSRYLRVYIRKSLPVSDRLCALAAASQAPNPACRDETGL